MSQEKTTERLGWVRVEIDRAAGGHRRRDQGVAQAGACGQRRTCYGGTYRLSRRCICRVIERIIDAHPRLGVEGEHQQIAILRHCQANPIFVHHLLDRTGNGGAGGQHLRRSNAVVARSAARRLGIRQRRRLRQFFIDGRLGGNVHIRRRC